MSQFKVGDRVVQRRHALADRIGTVQSVGWGYIRVAFDDYIGGVDVSTATLELVAPTVSPDVIDRMVRLVRSLSQRADNTESVLASECRAIAALLPPEPVPDDVLRAREICAAHSVLHPAYIESGEFDDSAMMLAVLAALREPRP